MGAVKAHDAAVFEQLQVEDARMYNKVKREEHELLKKLDQVKKGEEKLVEEDTKLRLRQSAVLATQAEMKIQVDSLKEKNERLVKMLAESQLEESELREELARLQLKLKATFVPHNILKMVDRMSGQSLNHSSLLKSPPKGLSIAQNEIQESDIPKSVPTPPPPPPPV